MAPLLSLHVKTSGNDALIHKITNARVKCHYLAKNANTEEIDKKS